MRIIEPSFKIMELDKEEGLNIIFNLTMYGRTCYKSEADLKDESNKKFIKSILDRGHESVIEHEKITVKIICDRGVSHEIVRHRIASYSQESTRYCNYSKEKFGGHLTFIKPCFFPDVPIGEFDGASLPYNTASGSWMHLMGVIEDTYFEMVKQGCKPEEARSVLPNSLKTEIVCTFNLREWRHFFKLRTSKKAHPQMREIARPLLDKFKELIPVIFDDIDYAYKIV